MFANRNETVITEQCANLSLTLISRINCTVTIECKIVKIVDLPYILQSLLYIFNFYLIVFFQVYLKNENKQKI